MQYAAIFKNSIKIDNFYINFFLARLSRRLIGELIGYSWSGVRQSSSVVHNAQYKLALATCSGVQNFRIVMQRVVSNWLCVSIVFYKKTKGKEVDLFFFLRPLHLICPRKK